MKSLNQTNFMANQNLLAKNILTPYPYAAPDEIYLRQAMIDSVDITFGNKDKAEGSGIELTKSKAFSTIATAIAAGNKEKELIDRFIECVRKMITIPANMPNFMAGLDSRGHCSMPYGIALLWNNTEVMSKFTGTEKSKIITLFKAVLISTAFTLNDFDENGNSRLPQRLALNGDTNNWNGSGVNYWEPNLTMFYSASIVLGLTNIKSILETYNHRDFIEELDKQGLISIKTCFEKTNNFSSKDSEEARLSEKINKVEAIVNNKWSFKRVTLDQYIKNPMKMYEVTQNICWDRVSQDGDYMGQLGMAHEFDCYDTMGSRQSSGYVVLGIDPILQNRILMHYLGFWDAPKNKEIRNKIEQLHKVGVSDYYAKVINGYYSQSWMGTHTDYLTSYLYIVDLMSSMGLIQEAEFNDTFNYNEIKEFITDKWTVLGENWSICKDTIIPYNIKYYLTNVNGVSLTDPEERVLKADAEHSNSIAYTKGIFKDIKYLVWIKYESAGEIGILGRVKDENNYYQLSYNNGMLSIKVSLNGKLSTLAEKEYTISEDTPYRFKGVFQGDSIDFHINGRKELSCVNNSFIDGAVGLLANHAIVNFDGVLVQNTNQG